jgi:hypothetical protein
MTGTNSRPEAAQPGREQARHLRQWVITLTVAVLAFVLGSAAHPAASASLSLGPLAVPPSHLAFDVQFIGQDTMVDLSPSGPSQGDEIILHDLLFAHGKQVGHSAGVCVFTDLAGGPEATCTVTFAVPGGEITTQFLNSPPAVKAVAVTGGTGRYRNVRGQGELVESGHETATLTFDLIGITGKEE